MDHVEVLRVLRELAEKVCGVSGTSQESVAIDAAIAALSAKPEGEAAVWGIEYGDGTRVALFEAPDDAMFKTCGAKVTPFYRHPPRSHGVVVDETKVSFALNAQPFTNDNDATRVWELFKDREKAEPAMRAALVAALGEGETNA